MPSPIGHALGGMAVGLLVARVPADAAGVNRRALVRCAGLCATVGVAPDLDLLVGAHSGPTHGLGAAVLVAMVAFAVHQRWLKPLAHGAGRLPAAVAAAYASHTLLDWLGTDGRAPIGIMALWPLTREYYESSLHVFIGVSRRYWLPGFWRQNLLAVLRELAILLPIVTGVFAVRGWFPSVLRRQTPHA